MDLYTAYCLKKPLMRCRQTNNTKALKDDSVSDGTPNCQISHRHRDSCVGCLALRLQGTFSRVASTPGMLPPSYPGKWGTLLSQDFYMPNALQVTLSTASKHWRRALHHRPRLTSTQTHRPSATSPESPLLTIHYQGGHKVREKNSPSFP